MVQERVATGASYIASGGTFTAGVLSINDWGVIVGMACAIGTFAVNATIRILRYRKGLKEEK